MNFECWASGTWAAGSWVVGSWCPGPEPSTGGMMYARRLPDAMDVDEDALILVLMGALLDE
jgi:hypothetical protein